MIQGEVTTVNINEDENIKGIKLSNKTKEIKISQEGRGLQFFLNKRKIS